MFFVAARRWTSASQALAVPGQGAEGTVLLVVGPSRCGKSSLGHTGLLHVMAEEPGWWTLPPICSVLTAGTCTGCSLLGEYIIVRLRPQESRELYILKG